jgi:uncharacterized membrane protein (UPF0136 family)
MQNAAHLYLLVFGVLTIAGGVLGFVRAKSKPSLVAGGGAGALLLAASYLMTLRPAVGLALGLVVSLALAGRFVRAFRASGKVMPAGLMAGLGIVGVLVTAGALLL